MSALRNLAGQTAIYGLSSIGARFLNYLLVPLYTSKGVFEPAEYRRDHLALCMDRLPERGAHLRHGDHLLPLLFEQGQGAGGRPEGVGRSPLRPIPCSSLRSCSWGWALPFRGASPAGIGFPAYGTSVLLLVIIIGIDALTTVPMARLRQQGRAWRFAAINITERGGERGAQPLHLPVLHEEVQCRR